MYEGNHHVKLQCISFGSTPSYFTVTFVNKVFVFISPNICDNQVGCLIWEIPALTYLLSSYLLFNELRAARMVKFPYMIYRTIIIWDGSVDTNLNMHPRKKQFSCGFGLEICPYSVFVLLTINMIWKNGVMA